jgi:hypothetical protein
MLRRHIVIAAACLHSLADRSVGCPQQSRDALGGRLGVLRQATPTSVDDLAARAAAPMELDGKG